MHATENAYEGRDTSEDAAELRDLSRRIGKPRGSVNKRYKIDSMSIYAGNYRYTT